MSVDNATFIKQLKEKYNLTITDPYAGVPIGWRGLLEDLISELCKIGWNRHVRCIKQKYGELR